MEHLLLREQEAKFLQGERNVKPLLPTLLFTIVVPGTVAGLIPYLIQRNYDTLSLNLGPGQYLGILLIILGVIVYLATAGAFAIIGRGTPAPIRPTQKLVIEGLHRYVRNPMYLGVLSVLLGDALWFQSGLILIYMAFIFAMFNTFIWFYEEPTLRRTYAEDYIRYCESTPRWIPRLKSD